MANLKRLKIDLGKFHNHVRGTAPVGYLLGSVDIELLGRLVTLPIDIKVTCVNPVTKEISVAMNAPSVTFSVTSSSEALDRLTQNELKDFITREIDRAIDRYAVDMLGEDGAFTYNMHTPPRSDGRVWVCVLEAVPEPWLEDAGYALCDGERPYTTDAPEHADCHWTSGVDPADRTIETTPDKLYIGEYMGEAVFVGTGGFWVTESGHAISDDDQKFVKRIADFDGDEYTFTAGDPIVRTPIAPTLPRDIIAHDPLSALRANTFHIDGSPKKRSQRKRKKK